MKLIFKKGTSLFSAPFDQIIQENAHVELVPNPLSLPTRFAAFEPQVLGSCNGLLWLSFKENCILWNPASRTHHVLPNDPTGEERTQKERIHSFHGLGYDTEHGDYKLVSVSQFTAFNDPKFVMKCYAHVWVYSLKSDSWKMVAQPDLYISPIELRDVFVNGSLHWKFFTNAGNVNGMLIAAFDVTNYKFQVIPKPDSFDKNSEFELGVLGGCLCVVPRGIMGVIGTFRVFEMGEYGNGSSWRELFRLEVDDGPKWMSPITYLGNQDQKLIFCIKEVLEGGGQLICCDLERNLIKDVQIRDMDEDRCAFSAVCVCMRSELVLDTVDGNDAVQEMQKMALILKKDTSLFSAPFDHTIQENAHIELVPNPLNLPTTFAAFEPRVLGYCHGLLCLSFQENCILWNPASRTHHVLPNDTTGEDSSYLVHGLGYDQLNDDYKLVRVAQFLCKDPKGIRNFYTEVWVYSLKSDSWKMVAETNWYVLPVGFSDVFVNGSLHCQLQMANVFPGGEYLILAFDVSKEIYQVIPKPDFVDKNSEFDLGVLDGSLCMVPNGKSEAGTFRVLEMREYGNGSSWRELFRFEMDDGPKWMRPITYLGNQNQKQVVLLEGRGQLFCFDVESDSIMDVQIMGMDKDRCDISEACVCMESERVLDTVDGNDAVEEMHGQEDDALNEEM